MTVSVLVPFATAGEGGERVENWRWLRRRLEEDLPDWEIVVGTDREGSDFSKGAAVNRAYARSHGDVFVIQDADCWIAPDVLRDAVAAVQLGWAPWAVPHGDVYRLSASTTAEVMRGVLPGPPYPLSREKLYRPKHVGPAGGGCVVLTRETYNRVGGLDARFHGWGGDDISFAWALDTLAGSYFRIGAPLWHLWHYPLVRRTRYRTGNERLAGRYREANGHPELMRMLIGGAEDDAAWAERVELAHLRDGHHDQAPTGGY